MDRHVRRARLLQLMPHPGSVEKYFLIHLESLDGHFTNHVSLCSGRDAVGDERVPGPGHRQDAQHLHRGAPHQLVAPPGDALPASF